jgi:uncharacterized protein with NAD-binding domain and iron-sulfur cluster
MEKPVRVAIIGGGCGAITAAYELSKPEHNGRYQVTLYQDGWRLGGKGASGRGVAGRIEEHGLHVWLGFYENAFRMMRECYGELLRLGIDEFGNWDEAFIQEHNVGIFSRHDCSGWQKWSGKFPPRPGLPGDAMPEQEVYSLQAYCRQAIELLRTLILDTSVDRLDGQGERKNSAWPDWLSSIPALEQAPESITAILEVISRYLGASISTGAASVVEGLGLLATAVQMLPTLSSGILSDLAEKSIRITREWLEAQWLAESSQRHIWEMADLVLAAIIGSIRFGVLTNPRGLEVLDQYECREWLRLNGASERALASPFMIGLYDLHLSYAKGDPDKPRLAAGQSMRGTLRMFFGYRGSFFWRMRAGMGDVVFAPLYKLLQARGVRFEFFHRLLNVGIPDGAALQDGDRTHVSSLEFRVQAKTIGDKPYQPLVRVQGKSCWPAKPDFIQLRNGSRLRSASADLESHWDSTTVSNKTLHCGVDFDAVVLGVSLGAIPHVCKQILARDQRWRDMVQNVETVATQAVQIWLNESAEGLGWQGPPYIISGYRKPLDTWCDMAHVVPEEDWSNPPKTSFYFCGVLPDYQASANADQDGYAKQRTEEVYENALQLLSRHGKPLWPKAYDETGEFCWDLLVREADTSSATSTPGDTHPLRSQYWRANVNPSDRYVMTVPGSNKYRISPLDMRYTNMTIAGDWTDSGFNAGCTEAAVMSGLLAAHAISGLPKLEAIIAYDHP